MRHKTSRDSVWRVAAAAILVLGLGACATRPSVDGVRRIEQPLTVAGQRLNAEWHLPPGAALQGLLSLQHGFSRRCDHLRGTAAHLAQDGWAVLCINANLAGGNPVLARELAAAVATKAFTLPDGRPLPEPTVAAGFSAGGHFAVVLAAALRSQAPPSLAGVLLFDPVAARGFGEALQQVVAAPTLPPPPPVWALLAPPGPCNARRNVGPALRSAAATAPASLVVWEGPEMATHMDVEGEDSDALATWACQGPPQPESVRCVRALARAALAAMGAAPASGSRETAAAVAPQEASRSCVSGWRRM